ncbi:uncharacterized protein LOC107779326 [Nicotiana tabacum]|uniref:Uncharacterized protein LOC107779326 n=1 Tax=Nicotiana tabacum TaxID=4097 RepID=A0AC58UC30_TOBAC
MNKQYGLQMTYMQAWRSKEYAVQLLRGNPSESYENLLSYFYMMVLTNPMSVVSLKKTEEDRFMYAFVALYPSIKGWQYCKPVVVVDGNFIKSTYRGTLLITSIQDPAGSILPLAYAIIYSENNASWEWFFARFKDAFGEREGICIVSDRHGGIENAAATLYPQLKDIFFAMAKAYTVEKFDYHMAEVERIDKRIKDYLINVGYERWSRAHSAINKTLTMTSNIAKSINAVLKAVRELPVTPSMSYLYSVLDKGKKRMVFLKYRTCSCRRFQLDEHVHMLGQY